MFDVHLLQVLSADRQATLRAAARSSGSRRSSWAVPAVARRSGAVTAGLLALVALGAVG